MKLKRGAIFLIILSLGLLSLVLIITLTSIKKQQIVQKKAAGGANASLSLPSSQTITVNQEFSVPVMLNTDGVEIIGADVVLNFDKNYLELTNVSTGPNSPFGTHLPVDSNGNFAASTVKNNANSTGKIEIGAVAFNWASEQVTSGFNGVLGVNNPLFTLTFKAKNTGQTSIGFGFSSGSTIDSNLVRINDDQVQDILSQVTNLSLNITSTTNTADLTFKIKFQGIDQQRPEKNVKVILKQQDQEKYRFNSVTVNADANGIYSSTISNITPGIYDIFIKGWTHLQKKFVSVTLNSGTNSKDWSEITLKAGDFNNEGETGYNVLNIDDIAKILSVYTALNVPVNTSNQIYDVNLDNSININDIALVLANYTALNVEGDK